MVGTRTWVSFLRSLPSDLFEEIAQLVGGGRYREAALSLTHKLAEAETTLRDHVESHPRQRALEARIPDWLTWEDEFTPQWRRQQDLARYHVTQDEMDELAYYQEERERLQPIVSARRRALEDCRTLVEVSSDETVP